jgi:polar amino acid transport system substrate-binding protein
MMKTKSLFISVLALWIFSLPFDSGAEQHQLKINCTLHSPYEAFFLRLVEKICARNGIGVIPQTPPVGRSLLNVNQGIDDGDGPRIGGLSATYPNLVRVPEPFGDFTFGAFAKHKEIRIDGWDSLKQLNVAYITGWKIFDLRVTQAKSITKVKNKDLLFRLLDADRTDVALMTRLSGYAAIRRLHLKGIRFLEPPLAVVPNFLYLNKRHEALAFKLADTLKALKEDGTYQRLYHEMISPHLPK